MNGSEYPVALHEGGSSGNYEIIYSQGNSRRVSGPYGEVISISNNGGTALIVVKEHGLVNKYIYDLNTTSFKNV